MGCGASAVEGQTVGLSVEKAVNSKAGSTAEKENFLKSLKSNGSISASGAFHVSRDDLISGADNLFGREEYFGFDGKDGWVSFDISKGSTKRGNYWIFVNYCIGDPRPLCVYIDGEEQQDKITTDVTGTYSPPLTWFGYGPFSFPSGASELKLTTDGYWPHVGSLYIVPAGAGAGAPPPPAPVSRPSPASNANAAGGGPQGLNVAFDGDQAVLAKIQRRSHPKVREAIMMAEERKAKIREIMEGLQVKLFKPTRTEGTVNIQDGEMIVVSGKNGAYEYDFSLGASVKSVRISISFASGDSRPVVLTLDGEILGTSFCKDATGDFSTTARERTYGKFPLEQRDTHTLKISTEDGYFPHVFNVYILDSETDDDELLDARDADDFITPPSRRFPHPFLREIRNFVSKSWTQEPDRDFKPDPSFYNSMCLDGLWICVSKACRPGTLERAAVLVSSYLPVEIRRLFLEWRAPSYRPRGPFRLVVLDNKTNQKAGDCPEFPDDWEGRNGTSNPASFTSVEDLWEGQGSLTVHELMHGVDMIIRQQIDPSFMEDCDNCHKRICESEVFLKCYARCNRHEYLAEITTLFCNTYPQSFKAGCYECTHASDGCCNFEPHKSLPKGKGSVDIDKKSDLKRLDPEGFELVNNWILPISDGDEHWKETLGL